MDEMDMEGLTEEQIKMVKDVSGRLQKIGEEVCLSTKKHMVAQIEAKAAAGEMDRRHLPAVCNFCGTEMLLAAIMSTTEQVEKGRGMNEATMLADMVIGEILPAFGKLMNAMASTSEAEEGKPTIG
jgi:hypothetical protein